MSDTPFYIDTLGIVAGTLTSVAFVPQVVKILRTRSTRDVSLKMYLLFATGVALWMVYGLLLSALPIVVFNAVTLVLAIAVVVMKLRLG